MIKMMNSCRILVKMALIMGLSCWFQEAFASELRLPKPTGRYTVGTKSIEVCDGSRRMFRGGDERCWMVQAFYPSVSYEGNYSYMPETLEDGVVWGTKVFAFAKLV